LGIISPKLYDGGLMSIDINQISKVEADALITDSRKYWIGVFTADCLPIFLIADNLIGIVHAGWRGTLKGITFEAVSLMNKISRVKKAILGVSICGNCYEVGMDVFNLFPTVYSKAFKRRKNGKFLFDLKKANRIQLKAAGIRDIEDIKFCTVCNNNLFHSYRKERTDRRILSAIRLL
jgi:YfiH family protein